MYELETKSLVSGLLNKMKHAALVALALVAFSLPVELLASSAQSSHRIAKNTQKKKYTATAQCSVLSSDGQRRTFTVQCDGDVQAQVTQDAKAKLMWQVQQAGGQVQSSISVGVTVNW